MAKLNKKDRKLKKQQKLAQKRIEKSQKVTSPNRLDKRKNNHSFIVAEQTRKATINHEKQIKQNKARKKAKEKYQKSLDLLEYKRESLKALGFEERLLTTTNLRKVKKADIDSYKWGKDEALSREKYPFIYPTIEFDFNKVYSFGKQGLYLAWLDYFGEHTLDEICKPFKKYENETLITFLDGIVHQAQTYNKDAPNNGAGTSSGRAGGLNSGFYSDNVAKIMYESDNRGIDKFLDSHEKKRLHTGSNKYYQLAVGGGEYTIKTISGRQLLILLNGIFYNITEQDRMSEYITLYNGITSRIPDFKMILPEP